MLSVAASAVITTGLTIKVRGVVYPGGSERTVTVPVTNMHGHQRDHLLG
jgi:hypothetical protein